MNLAIGILAGAPFGWLAAYVITTANRRENPMAGMYRFLPAACREGVCDHDPGWCVRYRSRRCLSGECVHARDNLMCGVADPPTPPPAPATPGN